MKQWRKAVSATNREMLFSIKRAFGQECIVLYGKHKAQLANKPSYDAFRDAAKLGEIKREIKLKGGNIKAGTMVMFVRDRGDFVTVWYPGILCKTSVHQGDVTELV
jgi:hypothetical protein